MTKTKIKILVVVAALLLCFVSLSYIYSLFYEEQETQFLQYGNSTEMDLMLYMEECKNEQELINAIKENPYGYVDFPIAYAVADQYGNIIYDSRSFLHVKVFNKDHKLLNDISVDIGQYLSTEVLNRYFNFCDKCIDYSPKIKRASLYKDGETYIPVEMEFYNSNGKQKTTIKFTDRYAPNTTFSEESSDGGYCELELSGVDFTWVNNNIDDADNYKVLSQKINDFFDSFEENHRNFDYESSVCDGNLGSNAVLFNERHFKIGEKWYCLYIVTSCNLVKHTLASAEFSSAALIICIRMIVVVLILLWIISGLYRKSKRITRSKEAFVSAAAHELKTPIAVIANNCECILEGVEPQKSMECVNAVYDESKRMSRMVKTLLQYNNLRTDRKIKKVKTDLTALAQRQLEAYIPLIEEKNITLDRGIEPACLAICDGELIGLVMDNYLSNAVKFTPDGGKITVALCKVRGKTRFEVTNSGSDISKEDAPHIWEELYCGDKSRTRKDGSTGMGLAICRVILELHKFSYGFDQIEDGVTFYFAGKSRF
ncbi:MAG: HAMP domain-containing histidine kinase [Clostridia bacterium]|nr:HAMP domain-containing histidine kinase [Clostridia bacterium]